MDDPGSSRAERPKGLPPAEDSAQISRLHRAEQMPIKVIARVMVTSRAERFEGAEAVQSCARGRVCVGVSRSRDL
jgi:hypothetical protein